MGQLIWDDTTMSGESDNDDDVPALVPAVAAKVPVTVITGFLGMF